MEVDLDALRAEAGNDKGHRLTVGGRSFDLPPILPLAVMESRAGDEAFRLLFGEDADVEHLKSHLSMFRSDKPSADYDPDNPESDFDAILELVYGVRLRPNREARRAGKNKK